MNEQVQKVRQFQIDICQGCLDLRGEMCDTPGCRFFLCSTKEIGEYLDRLLIRPVIDGKRVEWVLCETDSDNRLLEIADIIEVVDKRAMAVDGAVPKTTEEMTASEMIRIYKLARGRVRPRTRP